MKIIKNHSHLWLLVFGLLPFSVFSTPCNQKDSEDESARQKEEDASEYLEFYSQTDGKCQILSEGGKLRLVKNNHPDKKIKYRFNRIFAGKRQASMAVGVIEPGDNPVKLGCTKVDGHDQTWEIKVANFVE